MNSLLKRKINQVLIILFIFGIIINIAFSLHVFKKQQNSQIDIPVQEILASIKKECDRTFKVMGFRSLLSDNLLTVNKMGLDDYNGLLARSSIAIKSCPGFRIESACVGLECKSDFEMTLRFQGDD